MSHDAGRRLAFLRRTVQFQTACVLPVLSPAVQTIARCINGPRLAAILALFCEDYAGWRGAL